MKESENVLFAVRMNGSGMAIASNVAEEVNGVLYGFPSLLWTEREILWIQKIEILQ